ncbi:MAG: hypothetical protein Alis3KO_01120 [Aliiglaciecola sp.]
MFENNTNIIWVPVIDEKSGESVDPNDFVSAIYLITSLGGTELFRATLNDNITVVGGEFKVTVPVLQSNITGETHHEMQVVDAFDNTSTILQKQYKFEDTRI